jgi:hypothetical protein
MKKRTLPTILVLAVATVSIGVAAYYAAVLRPLKQKYEKVRAEVLPLVLSVAPIDASDKLFLDEVKKSWVQKYSEVGGPHSEALATVGHKLSVSHLVELLTYQMPAFSLFAPGQTKQSALIGAIQGPLLSISKDRVIHLSDDHHSAFLRLTPTVICVFNDDAGGLRETMYVLKKENIEQGDAADSR